MTTATREEMAKGYWQVLECWNDHKKAVRNKMTVERAIGILRGIREKAAQGSVLQKRAAKLLNEIVHGQANDPRRRVAQ